MLIPNLAPNTVVDECGSTNDLARQLAESGAPHGTWISARRQRSGRGRLGRSWESSAGNLFLSMIFRSEGRRDLSWLPLAAAVGMVEGLQDLAPVRIKWPNDLWLGQAKLGGILCEGVASPHNPYIVVGVGLNCESAPEGLGRETASLSQALGRRVSADEVRPSVVAGLTRVFQEFRDKGREAVRVRYERWALFQAGTRVEWQASSVPGAAPTLLQGVVEGLGEAGELRVRTAERTLSLFAEDVSLKVAH